MVDHEASDWLFWVKYPPIAEGPHRLNQLRTQNFRREVWNELVRHVDGEGYVALTPLEIATGMGRAPRQSRNVRQALKWLCNMSLMVDAGERGPHIYRLLLPPSEATPAPPSRRSGDPRLEAYDERAAAWSVQRRRAWRGVWRAMLLSADPDGLVIGDIGVLADVACDRFRVTVSDATVAKVLTWSVASGMTEYVYRGRVPLLRIIAGRCRQPSQHQHGGVAPRISGRASGVPTARQVWPSASRITS